MVAKLEHVAIKCLMEDFFKIAVEPRCDENRRVSQTKIIQMDGDSQDQT